LAAANAARIMIVTVAERTASDLRSGGPERSRPGLHRRAADARLPGGRSL